MFTEPAMLPKDDENSGLIAKEMILAEAERLFGERNPSFTIIEKITYSNIGPMVSIFERSSKSCVVILSEKSKESWGCFMYEMAHESIHLLYPQEEAASYLEEGVAVWFARYMCKKYNYSYKKPDGKYGKALELILKLDAQPLVMVRNIRSRSPNLTDISTKDIKHFYPKVERKDSNQLIKKTIYKTNDALS